MPRELIRKENYFFGGGLASLPSSPNQSKYVPAAARDAGKVGKKNCQTFNFPQKTEANNFWETSVRQAMCCTANAVNVKSIRNLQRPFFGRKSVCENQGKHCYTHFVMVEFVKKNFYYHNFCKKKQKKSDKLKGKNRTGGRTLIKQNIIREG